MGVVIKFATISLKKNQPRLLLFPPAFSCFLNQLRKQEKVHKPQVLDSQTVKREELNSAHGVQTFHIECRETVTWIEDKMRVLEQTDELKMDLTGIMTLQRNLKAGRETLNLAEKPPEAKGVS